MRNYKVIINKLYIIYFFKISYIILFLILYYNNYITNNRMYVFLLILIIILVYTRIIRYIKNNGDLINIKNIEKWLIISKYKNIFLYLLAVIEIKMYNIFTSLNLILYFQQYIVFILYEIIMQFFIKPIKLLYYFYYKVIIRWSSMSIIEFVFRRIEGLIFSVLIFSNLYMFILNQIKGIEFLCLYVILIIFNLVIEYNNGEIKVWQLKFNINHDYNSLLIYRYQVSIINIFILKYVEKNHIKINKRFKNLIHYWFLEDGFIASIDAMKLEVVHNWKSIKLELKKNPSILLYNLLYNWYNTNLFFSNLLDNKYYIEKNTDQKIIKLIKSIYQCDELKVKLLIYLLWDIEDYYGIVNIDHYKSDINMDIACLNIKNMFYDLSFLTNIKINHKTYFNTFYDLESNHEFFNKLYVILNQNKSYIKNINLVENNFNNGFDRTLDCYDGVDNEDDLVVWISAFINNLRENWLLLSMQQKKTLYLNIIQLLNEENNLSDELFKEPWVESYVVNTKSQEKFVENSDIAKLLDKLDAAHDLVELKKSKIRKLLEYFFNSL